MATSPKDVTPAPTTTTGSGATVPAISTRPSICMKPMPNLASNAISAGSPTGSLTSKEWIVPPRPKPGRKPATDTPPTKRKAQNRAAQRAFRERRAARVGELEEQLKQIEDEHEQEQEALRLDIVKLEKEVQHYREELAHWIDRCRQLENDRSRVSSAQPHTAIASSEHRPDASGSAIEQQPGCGNCTTESRCQCIDDVVNAMSAEASDRTELAIGDGSISSTNGNSRKRIKLETSDEMEIDFTAMYSRPKQDQVTEIAASPTSAVADPCGFCSDGTPCICAEMAAEQERRTTTTTTLPGTRQLAQFTPPPSEGDVVNPTPAQTSGCASGPGTCAQCQADPNSTLFCKSLAASRARSGLEGGCCGGKGADGACCQGSISLPARSTRSRANKTQLPPLQPPKSSITLSCADAYTTLSRHPAYERASGDIAAWLPKLHANPVDVEGRPALEIDAANVMSVLRDFDRRFGSDR